MSEFSCTLSGRWRGERGEERDGADVTRRQPIPQDHSKSHRHPRANVPNGQPGRMHALWWNRRRGACAFVRHVRPRVPCALCGVCRSPKRGLVLSRVRPGSVGCLRGGDKVGVTTFRAPLTRRSVSTTCERSGPTQHRGRDTSRGARCKLPRIRDFRSRPRSPRRYLRRGLQRTTTGLQDCRH